MNIFKNKHFWLLTLICAFAVFLRIIPYAFNGVEFYGLPDSVYEVRLAEIPFERVDNFTAYGYETNWGILYTLMIMLFKNLSILPLLPIVLTVGILIMVYFIGRRISPTVGLCASAILSFTAGSFFVRSMSIDHHIGEIFFSILFILCYLNTVSKTYSNKARCWWLLGTCLSGTAMMLVMTNCLIFPVLITIFGVVMYLVNKETNILKLNTVICIFMALMMVIFRNSDTMSLYYYCWLIPAILGLLGIVNLVLWLTRNINIYGKIAILVGFALCAVGAVCIGGQFDLVLYTLTPFYDSGISEMIPYSFTLFIVTFGLSSVFLIFGLVMLFYKFEPTVDNIFLIVWFVCTLWLTICHCRWEYIWVMPACMVIGIGIWKGINIFRESTNGKDLSPIMKGLFIFCLITCAFMCAGMVTSINNTTETEWQAVGDWFQNNTPDQPYYENGQPTYRVLCSWEDGHYIEVWGHRCPYSNPFQTNADSERMLITGEGLTDEMKYIVIDSDIYENSYPAMQIFAKTDIPVEDSACKKVFDNGNAEFEIGEIKVFTREEWDRVLSQ